MKVLAHEINHLYRLIFVEEGSNILNDTPEKEIFKNFENEKDA